MSHPNRALLSLFAAAAVFVSLIPVPAASAQANRPDAPEFPAGVQWLNTDRPLSLRELRGKFVLLDFWTYCCINCMHIIPDLKKLEAKYPTELVVIGVHSAKFKNEKESSNIREAILRYEIGHPVVNDADMSIWSTWGVNSWPTVALIDPDGKVVGMKSSEGVFEPVDGVLKQLIPKFEAEKKIDHKRFKFVLEKDNKPKSVLSYPGKLAVDTKGGRLFFTDSDHNRVVISSLTGAIQEVIGEGTPGLKDGSFATAQFFRPQGVCYDPARDALYIADTENHAVRKVELAKKSVSTLAGTGQQAKDYPPLPGTGTNVALSSPWDVLVRGDLLYVAMAGTHQLWTINLRDQAARSFAGTGRENIMDGALPEANFAQPSGLTTDGTHLFVADSEVSAIREVGLAGAAKVQTLIGQGLFEFGDVDGAYPAARLQHPLGVAYNPADGYIYVADTYNHKIKRVDPKTKKLETVVGTGQRGLADGPAKTAGLSEPAGLVWLGDKLYIADTNNNIIRVYHPDTKSVTTLKLTNLDRLAKKTMPAFHGKEVRVAEQAIAATATTLDITVQLPAGTKFNAEAPFSISAQSDKPDAVAVGALNISKAAKTISIPITAKAGQATITVDLSLNYCAEGNEGLCYFKEIRAVVPVRVEAGGRSNALVTVSL
jgi:DNA-binding beta-propeller fold protein YncE